MKIFSRTCGAQRVYIKKGNFFYTNDWMPAPRRQGLIWIGTIPVDLWRPTLHPEVAYVKGQKESGSDAGYMHWQIIFYLKKKGSLTAVKACFPAAGHYELTRSAAAEEYVFKEDTRVADSQFELGVKPFVRSRKTDWDEVWNAARSGDFMVIPANVRGTEF
ncbi:hypothetical protein [Circovirus-like genome DCCV-6]|uniref:hypothetical protein n=1 Tax=Circovirus-like genome DCCV-6 TaxID=1788446 RepID=UPI0007F9E03F|nr:hypothetical protein [Circovirus-like genome DCCV-6]AMB42966.1 hypothetical protein [Circovirus-like genome DCCV-6]